MSEDPVPRLRDYMNYWYTVRRPDRFHYCTPGLEEYKKILEHGVFLCEDRVGSGGSVSSR